MDRHRWMVGHMVALIGYCEREGLDDISGPLAEAMEKIAPSLRALHGTGNVLHLTAQGASMAAE